MWKRKLPPTISNPTTTSQHLKCSILDTLSGFKEYTYSVSSVIPSDAHALFSNAFTNETPLDYSIKQSGTWLLTVKDLAGNTVEYSYGYQTYYRYYCYYCGQNTNNLHYRCSSHSSYQSCSTFSGTCGYSSGTCGGTSYTQNNNAFHCSSCGVNYGVTWTCNKCGAVLGFAVAHPSNGCSSSSQNLAQTPQTPCKNTIKCTKTKTTNYRTN